MDTKSPSAQLQQNKLKSEKRERQGEVLDEEERRLKEQFPEAKHKEAPTPEIQMRRNETKETREKKLAMIMHWQEKQREQLKNGTKEQGEKRLMNERERARKRYTQMMKNETEEMREKRLKKEREQAIQRRRNETEDMREKRLKKRREQDVQRRRNETEEMRQMRLKKRRERYAPKKRNESEEMREEWLEKVRERHRNETEGQREKRLKSMREYMRKRYRNETEEQREKRLKYMREKAKGRQRNKTEDTREKHCTDFSLQGEGEASKMSESRCGSYPPSVPELNGFQVNTDEGHTSNTDTTRPKEIEEVSSECTDAGVKCTDAEASKGGVAWDGVYFHTVNLDCTGLEALLERRFHHPDFTCA